MSEKTSASAAVVGEGALSVGSAKVKEAVSIHTQKIYDACRERVCA